MNRPMSSKVSEELSFSIIDHIAVESKTKDLTAYDIASALAGVLAEISVRDAQPLNIVLELVTVRFHEQVRARS